MAPDEAIQREEAIRLAHACRWCHHHAADAAALSLHIHTQHADRLAYELRNKTDSRGMLPR